MTIDRFQLWNNCAPVGLVVESLGSDAEKIGLTEERLQTTVGSRLRGARIYTDVLTRPFQSYLYLNVNIVGRAFGIGLMFNKTLMDMSLLSSGIATTWNIGGAGTHGGDGGYVVQAVAEQTDRFINEYLRVNESACQ